ncbi:hypothetical protein J5N97_011022 [Dioscorea zingiberensis]|uniref:Glycosyltransferase n=1 Tax=Dioscorea zingiberensis TaxID=325984 RepID=A0A9D5D1W5_9LILI|nr:hypothetical protein J5N97_011022 [Dioscorea zingiberensis]
MAMQQELDHHYHHHEDDHEDDHPLHIAVFPWLAFGHMMPLLELSKTLANKGHHVSYLATPRNISRLSSTTLPSLLTFIPLPLPQTPGLPDLAEATSDVSPDQVQYLKIALDSLQHPFTTFLQEASPKPDWILLDFATPWAIPIASKFSIPCVFFSVFTASFLTFIGPPSEITEGKGSRGSPENFTVTPAWIPFPSKLAYSLHGARNLMALYESNASGLSDACRYRMTAQGCKALAPRTCREVERELVELLEDLHEKPVLPLGLLAPAPPTKDQVEVDVEKHKEIFAWLDGQRERSVVYVAFGSEATLSVELLHELALGLELSNLPFLWVLRKPLGSGDGVEVLPLGFEERVRGRGVVVNGWVPQLGVLGHGGVGGFLSHSGWSSIVEALQCGLPLMLLPIYVDQEANARMVGERGFGVEVERRGEDGFFSREEVTRVLRLVMVDEEGEGVRVRAREMKKVFADRVGQEKYVDEFVRFMKVHKKL